MCKRLFVGSDGELPLVELAAGGGDFQVRAMPDDRDVRSRLGVTHLVEALTGDGCSCDFDVSSQEVMVATFPGDATEEASLARAVACAHRLHAFVADAPARGSLVAYVCWWDEERLAPLGDRDVDADWFLRPALDDVDRCVLRVSRSAEGEA